jgi:hypothetical protein
MLSGMLRPLHRPASADLGLFMKPRLQFIRRRTPYLGRCKLLCEVSTSMLQHSLHIPLVALKSECQSDTMGQAQKTPYQT